MDFTELCALADKELNLGMAEVRLLERSRAEAKGVESHARQIYWHLRAHALQQEARESGSETRILELKAEIELQEKRLCARKERLRWFWAIGCFTALIGAVTFPRLAISAYARGGPVFYSFAFLGVACVGLAIFAYTASRYHTYTD